MNEHDNRDEILMAEVARGKREALEVLIRRHATPLFTFIEGMVGDRGLSEELFQDVFLAVWNKAHFYEYPRRFKSWLHAIALNKCRSAHRRKNAGPRATGLVPADDTAGSNPDVLIQSRESSPVEAAVATETAAIVTHAVTLLPPQQRAVVVLRVWQRLSYAEIANVLDTTEGTARSHMHHALSALRKYLEPRLG